MNGGFSITTFDYRRVNKSFQWLLKAYLGRWHTYMGAYMNFEFLLFVAATLETISVVFTMVFIHWFSTLHTTHPPMAPAQGRHAATCNSTLRSVDLGARGRARVGNGVLCSMKKTYFKPWDEINVKLVSSSIFFVLLQYFFVKIRKKLQNGLV